MGCLSSKSATKAEYPPPLDNKYQTNYGTGIYSNEQKAAAVNSINSDPYAETPTKPKPADLPQYNPALIQEHMMAEEQIRARQYPQQAGQYPPGMAGAYPQVARRRRRRPLGPGLIGGGAGGLGLGLLLGSGLGGGGFGGGCGGGGGGCGGGGC